MKTKKKEKRNNRRIEIARQKNIRALKEKENEKYEKSDNVSTKSLVIKKATIVKLRISDSVYLYLYLYIVIPHPTLLTGSKSRDVTLFIF